MYVDGFVIPVPKKHVEAYRRVSRKAGKIWREYGALEYKECVGEDLKTTMGTAFTRLARAKPGETVIFSWISYRSRKHRDRVNARVMKDPRIAGMGNMSGIFDPKRMAYGGFTMIVDL